MPTTNSAPDEATSQGTFPPAPQQNYNSGGQETFPPAPQQNYGYAGQQLYAAPVQPVFLVKQPTKKGFGVASMVLGICAVVFSWTAIFAFVLCLLSFIFGIVSLRRKETPRGFAITGIVLGSFAVVVLIIIAIIASFLIAAVTY